MSDKKSKSKRSFESANISRRDRKKITEENKPPDKMVNIPTEKTAQAKIKILHETTASSLTHKENIQKERPTKYKITNDTVLPDGTENNDEKD